MVRNWIEAVIDRLFTQLLSLVVAKLNARMELELAAVHADLLKEAEAYRCEQGEVSVVISKRLQLLAERVASEGNPGLVLLPSPQNETEPPYISTKPSKSAENGRASAEAETKRPRGRPRKTSQAVATERPEVRR